MRSSMYTQRSCKKTSVMHNYISKKDVALHHVCSAIASSSRGRCKLRKQSGEPLRIRLQKKPEGDEAKNGSQEVPNDALHQHEDQAYEQEDRP
mmetsp:Transcript_1468/g.1982  ORF Transcript_1468/g.1982 Transcript_1468/m.1982 type:complete len:93 (-) Transcript_1468:211-489(-)